ncbi:MMPL family transporter [Nakamurella endophytica]|uniref:Membrane protein n=1 Tax=Nakamurella endophytica TaxID=1748367 RepID=A0A917SN52_9ACTN|nr:MMPL family transporter [Nakamurella endophytica]GGL90272.1 membrane protein [Nakamurella endophytica]
MATLLYRLGAFAVRRRWLVLLAWVVVLAVVGGGALAFKGTFNSSFSIPGTEAQQAQDQLRTEIPAASGTAGRIVFAAPQGHTLAEAPYQAAIGQVVAEVKPLPSVLAVVDPQTGRTIAPNGRVAYAQVTFSTTLDQIPVATQDRIADIAAAHRTDGLEIELGGGAVKQTPSIGSTEGLGVVVALVVLLVTFASVVAAGMTMLTALIGVAVGISGILWVSGAVQMSSTAPILALMLGLAVGIDYSLFLVSRHRNQLRSGMPVAESIARATGTAGSAVVFAGLTVLIALAGLSVVGIPFLTIMGLAAAGTVAVAVLIAVTLVPALLAFAGDRVLRRRHRAAAVAARAGGSGEVVGLAAVRPNRWIRFVTRFPVLVVVGVIAVMGVVAIPTTKLHLALPDDGSASPDSTKRKAYDLLAGSFGPGFNGPLVVSVRAQPQDIQRAMQGVAAAVGKLPEQPLAVPQAVSKDGTFGVVAVIPKTGPSDVRTEDLVHDIRAAAPQIQSATGATIAVTGQTAVAIDVSAKLASALPVYLVIVVGLALILLLLVFRSIVVPVKAALGFLLSVGVSFGAVVAVYQWGWLGGLFGVDSPAPIISFLPILLIGVLFGLAMDYQVFLVSGMREAFVHGEAPRSAVTHGFSSASRVVTAAAIIMTSVFAGFILAPDTIIASIGFALGIGVLADAFLVRMTLVPAVMTLLGRAAWYIPRWLDGVLPSVDIEGERLLHRLRAERAEEPVPAGAPVPALAGAGDGRPTVVDGSAADGRDGAVDGRAVAVDGHLPSLDGVHGTDGDGRSAADLIVDRVLAERGRALAVRPDGGSSAGGAEPAQSGGRHRLQD